MDPNLRRPGIVYGIPILDLQTGQVRIDYVGKTFQQLWQREAQHGECQPFSDLIRGHLVVIESGVWTDAELDARETFHIARVAPRYNYEKNQHNPQRIPIWLAREQRWARDRELGRPLWVPPEQRQGRPVAPRESPRRAYCWPPWVARLRRRLARRLTWAGYAAAVWLGLFVGLFVAMPSRMPAGEAVRDAATAAVVVPVAGWLLFPRLQPRRRRRRSRR